MRLCEKQINKKGYYKYPNTIEKYYMDEPVLEYSDTHLNQANNRKMYSALTSRYRDRIFEYDGLYGKVVMTEHLQVIKAELKITFRGVDYEVDIINDRDVKYAHGRRIEYNVERGFCITGKAPDKKTIVYPSSEYFMYMCPVNKPKYRLSKDVVKYMLQFNDIDAGIAFNKAKELALQIMEEEEHGQREGIILLG